MSFYTSPHKENVVEQQSLYRIVECDGKYYVQKYSAEHWYTLRNKNGNLMIYDNVNYARSSFNVVVKNRY